MIDYPILLTYLPLAISALLGICIVPNMRLQGSMRVPLSGMPFFLITAIALCAGLAWPYLCGLEDVSRLVQPSVIPVLQIFVGCSLLFLVGLKHDLSGNSDFLRAAALVVAALLLPLTGLWIDDLHGLFGLHALSPYVGMPLTVLVMLSVTWAFSLLDGIDGLCCGEGSLVLMVFFALGVWGGGDQLSFVSAAALGVTAVLSILTLVRRSWRHTMMGNSGSYVLGYLIGCQLVASFRNEAIPDVAPFICMGALTLPVLDVVRVFGSRIRDGRSIDSPDRNHINHKLLRTGMRPTLIPWVILFLLWMFVGLNAACLYWGCQPTLIVLADVALWIVMHYLLNWQIHAFEQLHHKEEWNKVYGEAAWNRNIPHEVMRHKVATYGTMGLPPHLQCENPIEFIPDGMTGFGRGTKRLWDFFLSCVCLIAFSPLFLFCYVLIKLDDGGPVIYRQERIGRFGRPFFIYKFRSMRVDAEKDGPALSHANGDEDPRLTKVGRFLREHHLDELPQLCNVFMGDMAFIGYRPERKYFIDQIMQEDPRYAFLYQIRPGVTSYATLYNGYTDTMAKMLRRLELDLYYLRHRSWWFDCKVLFLTFTSIVFGKKF